MAPDHDQLISLHQVVGITGVPRGHLYLLMRAGLFPLPKRHNSPGWEESEVLAWMKNRKPRTRS